MNKRTKRVLIIEDNKNSLQGLCKIVEALKKNIIVYTAQDVSTAYKEAMEQTIDLFLIDIILDTSKPGDVSGMTFADRIRKVPEYEFTPIIFITALEDSQLYAYSKLHCYGYLEKPYNVEEAQKLIGKALEFPTKASEIEYVYFRKDGILYPKQIKDIIYIENSKHQVIVHMVDDELILPYKTCKEILKDLASDTFFQCSRTTIVNKQYIENIDYVNRYIKLKKVPVTIEIGAVMKKRFMNELNHD